MLKKQVVICDRFTDPTLAYQVYGKKVDIKFINNIHKKILGKIKPNLVFILKVSAKSSKLRLKRKSKIGMIILPNFFILKLKNILKIAKNKKNYFVLDSSSNDDNLEKKIFNIVKKYLNI